MLLLRFYVFRYLNGLKHEYNNDIYNKFIE